jgi:hypothetical protein
VTTLLYQWLPESLCRLVSYCTVVPHYQAFQRGLFDTSELTYSILITLLFLYFARTVLAYAASGGGGLFLPGALRDKSTEEESFENGLLEYPQYTQPAVYEGEAVPEVLLSGNHEKIRKWRLKESLRRTLERRPDLLAGRDLTREEEEILRELKTTAEDAELLRELRSGDE